MKLYFRMWTGINYLVVSKFMHICMNLRQLVKYLIWVLVSLLLLFVILRTFHLCHQMGNCFALSSILSDHWTLRVLRRTIITRTTREHTQHSAYNKTFLHVSLLTYFVAQSCHLPAAIKKSFYDELFGSLTWNY